jgi:putative phosphoesterase
MKVAIISDTHDTLDNVDAALTQIKDLRVEAIIHCGDWCAPFTFQEIAKAKLPVYGVFGNNDGAQFEILEWIKESGAPFTIEREILEFSLDNKKIAVNHYPQIATSLAASKEFDVVCFGHNHHKSLEKQGATWLIDPGSLSQRSFGGPSFAIYDTESDTAELIELKK